MTRLFLIRHAESIGNINNKFCGWTDCELAKKGFKQSKRLAEHLNNTKIDVLYSSDLKRAFCTAQFIAESKGIEINIVQDLREMNGGCLEDKLMDDLMKLYPDDMQNIIESPHLFCPSGGENTEEFRNRLIRAIDNIILENKEKNICVVTHETVIRVLLCHFYCMPIEELKNIPGGDNTSITIVNIDEKEFKVAVESDNSHLDKEFSTFAAQFEENFPKIIKG